MIIPVIFLVSIIFPLSIINNDRQVNRILTYCLPLLFFILVIITTFRPTEMPDYENYLTGFRHGFNRGEPAFNLIMDTCKQIYPNFRFLLFMMAIISISINLLAIKFWGNSIALSLLYYMSNMFILHDMIQIRCAVAAAIFLFTIPCIYNNNFPKFLIFVIIACCFHYSSIIILPLFFLSGKKFNKYFWILLIPISYIIALAGFAFGHLAELIPIDIVQTYNKVYTLQMKEIGITPPNIFNVFQLLRVFVILVLIIYSSEISRYNKYFTLWLKIYIISMVLFILSTDYPIIAFRVTEFYQVVEFLLFPLLIYIPIRDKEIMRLISSIISLIILFINIFHIKLLL